MKTDLRKTHNTFSWEFIEHKLVGLGFPRGLIDRLMESIINPRFSTALNWQQFGHFISGSRLRWGDLISPLPFNLYGLPYQNFEIGIQWQKIQISPKCNEHRLVTDATRVYTSQQNHRSLRSDQQRVEWHKLPCDYLKLPRYLFTTWTLMHSTLQTRDRLSTFRLNLDPKCNLCGEQLQTNQQILIDCTLYKEVLGTCTTRCFSRHRSSEAIDFIVTIKACYKSPYNSLSQSNSYSSCWHN